MLLTVAEFRDTVDKRLSKLVEELRSLTGRFGEAEASAWRSSLPKLAKVLTHPKLDNLHLHFAKREHHVALEYQLPGASAWCDVVLLGQHAGQPATVMIELKDWDTRQDKPGSWEGLIEHRGTQELHPSEQVRGYVHYCQRFHSAVLDHAAQVHGFVLFTSAFHTQPYLSAPNESLAGEFPLFTTSEEDAQTSIPDYLLNRLTESNVAFAEAFTSGTYRQNRSFMAQIGQEILQQEGGAFELLDNQRRAFALCQAKVNHLLADKTFKRRKVIVVEGPPGSGKSAVAARVWASLVTNKAMPDGNVALVTTSQSQSSNWSHLIDKVSGARAGRGVARKATSFTPITTVQLNKLRQAFNNKELFKDAAQWRENMKLLEGMHAGGVRYQPGAEDNSCLVTLVDEAHALINPELEHGVGQYGFVTGLGPQAYQIIRASRITVFFIDPRQSFRARENTSLDSIKHWAVELDADVETVSLAGAQFRCAGSAEYVAWAEALLEGAPAEVNRVHASSWQGEAPALLEQGEATGNGGRVLAFPKRLRPKPSVPAEAQAGTYPLAAESQAVYEVLKQKAHAFDVRVFEDPFALEAALRKMTPQYTVRLVSSYSRPWKTEGMSSPHSSQAEGQDFCEAVTVDGETRLWAKPWNVVPNGADYTSFIQGRPGTPMADDPLCEVGCTYAVRGFDYHYLGLIWLDDLLWRDGRWVVQVGKVLESGIALIKKRSAKEGEFAPAGPHGELLMQKVTQAYRILMTRAIHGLFIWAKDEETRKHLRASLSSNG